MHLFSFFCWKVLKYNQPKRCTGHRGKEDAGAGVRWPHVHIWHTWFEMFPKSAQHIPEYNLNLLVNLLFVSGNPSHHHLKVSIKRVTTN